MYIATELDKALDPTHKVAGGAKGITHIYLHILSHKVAGGAKGITQRFALLRQLAAQAPPHAAHRVYRGPALDEAHDIDGHDLCVCVCVCARARVCVYVYI